VPWPVRCRDVEESRPGGPRDLNRQRGRPTLSGALTSWRPAACLAVLLLLPGAAWAGEELPPLSADRPDQTNGPGLVPPGTVQVELGATRAEATDGGNEAVAESWGQTLVRLGLFDDCELRLAFDGWREVRSSGPAGRGSIQGTGDSSIGAKLRLVEEGARRPAVSLLATLILPTGEVALRRARATPQVVFAFGHELSPRLSLSANLGAEWDTLPADAERPERAVLTGLASASLGIGLGERWGAFVELFGVRAEAAVTGLGFDAGLACLLRPNLQIDAAASVRLDGPLDDRFATIGLSFRLPH